MSKSGSIRTNIANQARFLTDAIANAQNYDPKLDTEKSDQENLAWLNNLLIDIDFDYDKIKRYSDKLEKLDIDWQEIIVADAEKEEALYNKFMKDIVNHNKLIYDGKEKWADLLKIKKKVGLLIQNLTQKIERELATAHPPTVAPSSTTKHIRMPQLEISKFRGDPKDWNRFWDQFKNSVHISDVPKIEKLALLIGYLDGYASNFVQGIPVEESSYDLVVSMLEKKFGDPEMVITILYEDLEKIASATSNLDSISSTYLKIRKITRQLEHHGEDLNQKYLIRTILKKWPGTFTNELIKSQPTTGWDMSTLLNAIEKIVNEKEKLTDVMRGKTMAVPDNRENRPRSNNQHGNAFFVARNSSHKKSRDELCLLCKKTSHKSFDCYKHLSVASRKQETTRQKRCFSCLSSMHTECNHVAVCRFCGENHHSIFCEKHIKEIQNKRVAKSSKPSKVFAAFDGEKSNKSLEINSEQSDNEIYYSREGSNECDYESYISDGFSDQDNDYSNAYTIPIADSTIKKERLALSAQKAFVSCIRVKIFNPTLKHKWRWATVMFDNGSERSWIVEDLANALGLNGEKSPISINTFNSDEIFRLNNSKLVEASLRLENGENYSIKLQTAPKISDRKIRSIVVDKSLDFNFENSHLAPSSVKPDILIGQDHHWKLLLSFKELPSGFYLVKTKFGDMIGGTGNVPKSFMEPISVCSVFNSFECKNIQVPDVTKNEIFRTKATLEDFKAMRNLLSDEKPMAKMLDKLIAKETGNKNSLELAHEKPKISEPTKSAETNDSTILAFKETDSESNLANAKPQNLEKINNLTRTLKDRVIESKLTVRLFNPERIEFQ